MRLSCVLCISRSWQLILFSLDDTRRVEYDGLMQKIRTAFADAPRPADDALVCDECEECAQLRDSLRGRSPDELSDAWVERSFDQLPLMSTRRSASICRHTSAWPHEIRRVPLRSSFSSRLPPIIVGSRRAVTRRRNGRRSSTILRSLSHTPIRPMEQTSREHACDGPPLYD